MSFYWLYWVSPSKCIKHMLRGWGMIKCHIVSINNLLHTHNVRVPMPPFDISFICSKKLSSFDFLNCFSLSLFMLFGCMLWNCAIFFHVVVYHLACTFYDNSCNSVKCFQDKFLLLMIKVTNRTLWSRTSTSYRKIIYFKKRFAVHY